MMNDTRRLDARRRLCEELATRLATDEGVRTARLLQVTGLLAPPTLEEEPPSTSEKVTDGPRPISIWQPRQVGGELIFERPAPLLTGDHYAAQRTLRTRKEAGTRRICFFGESAAAGYLYAPHLTPATVLASTLDTVAGPGAYEVVDLARTDERLDTLVATAEASLQLAPDVLVVFAGNNWCLLETPEVSPYAPDVTARQGYALALRQGGVAGVVAFARRRLRHRVEVAFATLAAHAQRAGATVILVLPAVNLTDWESRQPVTWLPGDGAARWHACYDAAVAHLHHGRWQAAIEEAQTMLRFDGGHCTTAHRLWAQALIGLDKPEEAALCCRDEVEAESYATLCFLGAPRAGRTVHRLLTEQAAAHGFGQIDLPQIFAQHADTPLVGRRYFLDYCHLTAEGMQVAMAAIAAAVHAPQGHSGRDAWRAVLAAAPPPAPAAEVDGLAKLGAALHSAHRLVAVGAHQPLLTHWCRQALAVAPEIATAMLDLTAARAAPCPAVLTAAQARNAASAFPLNLQHGWRWDFLDVEMLLALLAALEEAGHGTARAQIEAQLLAHHGVGREGVELSRAPYLWAPLERFYPEVMPFDDLTGRAFYRAPWSTSRFALITDGEADLKLQVCARLPAIEGWDGVRSGEVLLRSNGETVGRLALGETWQRAMLPLARHTLQRGINRLSLRWPPLPPAGDAALEAAAHRLEHGREADLHPVFGEVESLFARPGR